MVQESNFRRIDVVFARELLNKNKVLVLDVRDPDSFERGHIQGAQHAGQANLFEFLSNAEKAKPILIYCFHGNSSQVFAKTFADFGFQQVFSLDGGFESWKNTAPDFTTKAIPTASAPASIAALSEDLRAFLDQHGFPPNDVNATTANKMTSLMTAAYRGPPALVAELLQLGAAVDACNSDGSQPLWLACVGDDAEIVDMLIAAGADLDHKNVNGSTALMYAASAGKAKALAKLLAAGSDLDYEVDGFSALDMAATLECLNLMRKAKRQPIKA
jgi:rhodanese-related sulfurtransferase